MLYPCVRRFDVTGTVQKILGTKQGLKISCFLLLASCEMRSCEIINSFIPLQDYKLLVRYSSPLLLVTVFESLKEILKKRMQNVVQSSKTNVVTVIVQFSIRPEVRGPAQSMSFWLGTRLGPARS